MIPKNRIATSPGIILLEEFLRPLELTQSAFARHIGVSARRINDVVRGKSAISPELAQLFSAALGTTPEFWMNAQSLYDLSTHRIEIDIEPLVHTS